MKLPIKQLVGRISYFLRALLEYAVREVIKQKKMRNILRTACSAQLFEEEKKTKEM